MARTHERPGKNNPSSLLAYLPTANPVFRYAHGALSLVTLICPGHEDFHGIILHQKAFPFPLFLATATRGKRHLDALLQTPAAPFDGFAATIETRWIIRPWRSRRIGGTT